MSGLRIRVASERYDLEPGQAFTFGRDQACTVCLDPDDTGISRVAGSIGQDAGTWWIVNRSAKRTLHVVDDTGFSMPLPVNASSGQPSRRAVDHQSLTVVVTGDIRRHAIEVARMGTPAAQTVADPKNPISTVSHRPTITDNQREALVALLSGYLQLFPRHDPRPLTYRSAGQVLGVSEAAVRRRIESLRGALVEEGVPGLQGSDDARPVLAEWAISERVVQRDDLAWLEQRPAERQHRQAPS